MLHCGMGATHVSNWLSSLNIPSMASTTLKRREREIGTVIEEIAEESCNASLELEKRIVSNELHETPGVSSDVDTVHDKNVPENPVELTVSYDMGWQRRSSGRTYNSKSGHACIIGQHTGNILAYGSRKSSCRTCEMANAKHTTPVKHDCRYNWSGSAKSMEPSVGVELLNKTRTDECAVKCVVMDNDTTTLSHIRKEYDPQIKKWSDINHSKKTLTNHLYTLAKKHKKLNSKVISYFKRMYSYVLVHNKNNEEGVRDGLRSITPHAFGDHNACGSWCGFQRIGDSYKYKYLPRGQPLSGDEFREDVATVFEVHALNADRLAPLGSTKANESFNNIVATKAPKNRHYSSSESLDYRIGAAVSQKNIGHGYLLSVYKRKNMSPGRALVLRAYRLQKQALKRKEKATTKSFKKRRLELAESRTRFTEQHEIREGTSYETNIAMSAEDMDVTKIPDPLVLPESQTVQFDKNKLVIFDLETSSGEWDTDICQISACVDVHSVFNRYIVPEKPISPFASNVTGLTVHEKTLLCKGEPVATVSKQCAIEDFVLWLKTHGKVVLVGHNVKSFDAVHLLRAASQCHILDDIQDTVVGFIDTLPHFRAAFPSLPCHKEVYLVETLLQKTFDAHNALADCIALRELLDMNSENLHMHSFEIAWAVCHMKWLETKHVNLKSYSEVIRKKIMSKVMAEKCSASGLRLSHINLAFSRRGEEGVKAVLGEKLKGTNKIRVTNRKCIIEKLCSYFSDVSSPLEE